MNPVPHIDFKPNTGIKASQGNETIIMGEPVVHNETSIHGKTWNMASYKAKAKSPTTDVMGLFW